MSGRGSNRGAYYKAKYARGGGRGSRVTESIRNDGEPYPLENAPATPPQKGNWSDLSNTLRRIDNKPYGFYKDLAGQWHNGGGSFILRVDHVQSDPYAPPSRVSVKMGMDDTGIPTSLLTTKIRRVALADYITRVTADFITEKGMFEEMRGSGWKGPKGGAFNIHACGQQAIERTSCVISEADAAIELRFSVKLPARGRTILGSEASAILVGNVPELVEACLRYPNLGQTQMQKHVDCIEQQARLRSQLHSRGLVAFIANGSILPRKSGAADLPMEGQSVVPFQTPENFEVELEGIKGNRISGMGIPKGITILTGGGFHGKSTLLEAIQSGIWDVVPGDGRELVVTDPTAVKIRAEDGRSVSGLDITPFITNLPGAHLTQSFTTADASGSSSMSANIQEALETGSKLLLIDEDTSATNLLIRDARMRTLIPTEPITPLVSRVRALHAQHAVSTILVVGGCGDYLDVADHVIGMQDWRARDLSAQAKRVAREYPAAVHQLDSYGDVPRRRVRVPRALAAGGGPVARSMQFIETREAPRPVVRNPSEERAGVDLAALEQLVDVGQTRVVAEVLQLLALGGWAEGMAELVRRVERLMDEKGLDAVHRDGWIVGDLVRPRAMEIAAAVSRVRSLQVE